MSFVMLVFWGGLIALTIVLLRSTGWAHRDQLPPTGGHQPTDAAERILHERFARGEIDEAEYTRRRDLLRSK